MWQVLYNTPNARIKLLKEAASKVRSSAQSSLRSPFRHHKLVIMNRWRKQEEWLAEPSRPPVVSAAKYEDVMMHGTSSSNISLVGITIRLMLIEDTFSSVPACHVERLPSGWQTRTSRFQRLLVQSVPFLLLLLPLLPLLSLIFLCLACSRLHSQIFGYKKKEPTTADLPIPRPPRCGLWSPPLLSPSFSSLSLSA